MLDDTIQIQYKVLCDVSINRPLDVCYARHA